MIPVMRIHLRSPHNCLNQKALSSIMTKIGTFLDMGGYAGFVWPSYAAVIGVLAALLWLSMRGLKAAESELARLEEDSLRARRGATDDGATGP